MRKAHSGLSMRQRSLSARQKWCRKRATNGAAKASLGQSSEERIGSEPAMVHQWIGWKICYGNHGFSREIWGFHGNFPLNHIHWYHDFPSAPLTNDTPAFRWFHLPKPQKRHPLEQESLASGHEETHVFYPIFVHLFVGSPLHTLTMDSGG